MEKTPFTTKEKLEEIAAKYPTPFHIYDEAGIRRNAENLKKAFAWNKGFKEYFAVKATPNPFLINILREYGCGCDCSSVTELMLSKAIGAVGDDVMFSSNDTPPAEFKYAADMGAIINLDDITHLDIVEKLCVRIAIIKKGQIQCVKTVEEIEASGTTLEQFYLDTITGKEDNSHEKDSN